MEIRNLNTFLKVADLLNFTRAGRELGYSQSNVSAQIKQLEEELGEPLFDRIGKNVSLTQYGRELLPYAHEIVSAASQLDSLKKPKAELGGLLRIGCCESLFTTMMQQALLDFHAICPKVQIEIVVNATSKIEEDLGHGLLDLACIIEDMLSTENLVCKDQVAVPVVIAANPGHPLVQKEHPSISDLSGYDIILMEDTAPYNTHFRRLMTEKDLAPNIFLKLESAETARRLTERGMFLSVLPIYTVKKAAAEGKVRILDTEPIAMQYAQIVLHRQKVMTPQIETFVNVASKSLRENCSSEAL